MACKLSAPKLVDVKSGFVGRGESSLFDGGEYFPIKTIGFPFSVCGAVFIQKPCAVRESVHKENFWVLLQGWRPRWLTMY